MPHEAWGRTLETGPSKDSNGCLGQTQVAEIDHLVDLIARGYGTLTWAFLVVYVVPVLTWGVWLAGRQRRSGVAAGQG